ncbi:MAG: FHA domain-containing protein [Syntrophomonadaceae bacterium]|jgi:ABC-type multidrug transport system ATPase subunit/pSer/pThr/pTyr-binding forkhead associated (FHA) protein|nr:FHA domain-containing protein [Syntrophomonadaceae bacterium]
MVEVTLNKTAYFRPQGNDIASASMNLTILDGESKPVEINLTGFGKETISFGREETNDIVLCSQFASRRHGRFRLIGSKCLIEDLNSTNGLIFSNESIKSRILEDGDIIRIDDGLEPTKDGVLLLFSNSGPGEWKTFLLAGQNNVSIGRENTCDIVLEHISVSRIHARITREGSGFCLINCDSTNGVFINGVKVNGKHPLHEKDVILITNSKLIICGDKLIYRCFQNGVSVEARNIIKTVDNKKTICNDVSLSISPCEMVAIVGGSGAGKSTVMNCLGGYSLPTEGSVLINGMDLYANFNSIKSIMGYVPQADIVYDSLTIFDMLNFAAKLRLPGDAAEDERGDAVNRALETVGLADRKDTLIRKLSGGQKKRASIAVELLSDPKLFFLDEPASGLDPGTERSLMGTLRNMADSGKTVVFVTHSTLHLNMCDKIIFMGAGGNLCFFGSLPAAMRFFSTDDIVDIYKLMSGDPAVWKEKFKAMQLKGPQGSGAVPTVSKPERKDCFSQSMVLSLRTLRILLNDRVRLLLILLQAPLLAALISLVADGHQFEYYGITKSLLFALSCSGFWIGILNSIQEVCKEKIILKREYMTGLRLDAYIFSKLIVMTLLCAAQSIMLTAVFTWLVGQPEKGLLTLPYAELLLNTFLTALAASATGIFVSTLFSNADRAMTVAPLLLLPQLLFSGLIFDLSGVSSVLSWAAVCRWSMSGYGTSANLNNLPQVSKEGVTLPREAEAFFDFAKGRLMTTWGILILFVIIFSAASYLVLQSIKRDAG